MENRPELQQSNVQREINQIDQKYFKDQTKPAVDLVGTYGVTGLAGSLSTAGVNPFTASNLLVRQRVDELSVLAGLDPLPIVRRKHFLRICSAGLDSHCTEPAGNRYQQLQGWRADQFAVCAIAPPRRTWAVRSLRASASERNANNSSKLFRSMFVMHCKQCAVRKRVCAPRWRRVKRTSSSLRVNRESWTPDNRQCFSCWNDRRVDRSAGAGVESAN